jgi:hypothetical protein
MNPTVRNIVFSSPGWILRGAKADIDFVGGRSFPSSRLGGITTVRSGTAWADDVNGAISSFSANTLRRTNRGLFSEKAVTNSWPVTSGISIYNSDDTNITRTVGPAGPDGQNGVTITSVGAGLKTWRLNTVTNNSSMVTYAVVVPKNRTAAQTIYDSIGVALTLTGGTTVSDSAAKLNRLTGGYSGGTAAVTKVLDRGDYWILVIQRQNNGTGNTNGFCYFYPQTSGADDAFMPQLILSDSELTSIIPQASASRAADVYSSTVAQMGLSATGPLTMQVEWGECNKPASGRRYLASLSDGTANNRIAIFFDSSGFVNAEVVTGGVQQCLITGNLDRSKAGKASFAVASNDAQFYVNGISIGTGGSVSLPTGLTVWHHGCDQAGANQLCGPIKRVASFASRLPAAQQASYSYLAPSYAGGTLTHWFGGTSFSGKKVVFNGDSTFALGSAALFPWLSTYMTASGQPLAGATIVNKGSGGASMNAFNTDGISSGITDAIAQAADVYVLGFGINDVRLGTCDQATLRARIVTGVNALLAGVPNCDIVLWSPASFLSTDTGAGSIVPNSSAQIYNDIIYNAYESLRGNWPNVAVLHQQSVGGWSPRTIVASSVYMSDQLHPVSSGQMEQAYQIGTFLCTR